MESAQLFIGYDWTLFTGRVDTVEEHRNPAHTLIMGIDGPFRMGGAEGKLVRSAWVYPGATVPKLDYRGTRIGHLLLGPHHPVARRAWHLSDVPIVSDGLPAVLAAELPGTLARAASGDVVPERVLQRLDDQLPGPQPEALDPRVRRAIHALLEDSRPPNDQEQLALHVGLSPSRLGHLFRQEIGMSIGRFRLWTRIQRLAMAIGVSGSITEAALNAGFRDPSQLARDFRMLFGLKPSGILRNAQPVAIHPLFDGVEA
ncbi:helix-turn-helix domain-containing protein [Aquisalimonas asiatica]|uniref:AraC-type DNA-binding protein n=1 Tax=Aquisalimonas asiatica TaxID=406100 RepID=A0A1H8PRD4_9GAMM|nr:AraC family transcriptional regulator [Aquisalimonas asiatica]SEO44268.1 AraC-type DNA-binding protein [Aquisalimonas asiatica]